MASNNGLGPDYDISIGAAPVNLATAGATGKRISMVNVKSVDVVLLKGAGTAAANEQQTIDLGAASAGTVTITFAGQTTGSINFNANAATVQSALEALSNVEPGEITVTGGPFPASMTLTFSGQYANTDVSEITATPTGLTGGTITINTTVQGGSDPAMTLKSHTLSTGGSSTSLAVITEYFVKSEATLDGDEVWTKVSQSAAATVADPGGAGTSAEQQQLVVFNVRADQMPAADNWLSVDIADVGTAAQLATVIYIIHKHDKGDPTAFPAPLR